MTKYDLTLGNYTYILLPNWLMVTYLDTDEVMLDVLTITQNTMMI
jgi:hypothetical protein